MSAFSPRQMFSLDEACKPIAEAFDEGPFLVGTAATRQDYRDVDVRLILDDETYARLVAVVDAPLREFLGLAIGEYLAARTGLPIDFQIQQQTAANHAHAGVRNPLGIRTLENYTGDAQPDRHAAANDLAVADLGPEDYDVLSLPLTVEKLPPAQMWFKPMQRSSAMDALPRITGVLRGHWPRLGRREELPGESGPLTVTNVDLFETADGHLHRADQQPARPPRIECTCPTGDGSLRWPCPVHPPLGTVIQ